MLKRSINAVLCFFVASLTISQVASAEIIEVNFVYVGDKDNPALLGAKQGLEEANLQGQFLNQKYNLDIVSAGDITTHDFKNYIAVLSATEANTFRELSKKLSDKPVFNLTVHDDELRMACIENALHIIPSTSMSGDAVTQWKQKKPDSKAASQAWHPDFVKYAARDLNKRFKKAYGVTMNDYSWAGWAAVKMTSDTVARSQITDATKMLDYLKTELTFDGQKGIDMTFRITGQLRQPILLVEDNKIVAEAPVRGVAKPPTLDSLGITDCEK